MIWTGIILFALGCIAGAVVSVTIRLTVWEEDEDEDSGGL